MYYLGPTNAILRRGVEKFEGAYSMQTIPMAETSLPGPFSIATFKGRAWGNSRSNIDDMTTWLLTLAISRLAIPFGRAPNFSQGEGMIRSIFVEERLDDRIVDVMLSVQVGASTDGKMSLGTFYWPRLGIPNNLISTNFDPLGRNPQPPNDRSTRGTYPGFLVAQLLANACGIVPSPPLAFGLNYGKDYDNYSNDDVQVQLFQLEGPPLPDSADRYRDQYPTPNTTPTDGLTIYQIDTLYSKNYNVHMAAVAGGTQSDSSGNQVPIPPEIMTLANPVSYRIVKWTSECAGAKPLQPAPISGDKNYVLVRSDFQPAAPVLAADGHTVVWSGAGQYIYCCRNAAGAGDNNLVAGLTPWLDFAFADAQYSSSDFVYGIIGPPPPQQQTGGATGGGTGPQV
jgi:hypothetical protein